MHFIKPVYNLISCKMLHTKYCKPVDKILFDRKKNYPIWAFFFKSLAKTFIFVDYIIQCYLESLSVDIYLHLRKDRQQDCLKVLV